MVQICGAVSPRPPSQGGGGASLCDRAPIGGGPARQKGGDFKGGGTSVHSVVQVGEN